jgi:hypothetical protein
VTAEPKKGCFWLEQKFSSTNRLTAPSFKLNLALNSVGHLSLLDLAGWPGRALPSSQL